MTHHVPDPAAPATAAAGQTPEAPTLWRRALAEGLGTALLVAIVVGSGIMAQQLSDDVGLQLLENSLATTLGLAVLILMFQQVSGSHFNPVVTLVERVVGGMDRTADAAVYVGAQLLGGLAGAALANAMFDMPTTWSTTERATPAHLLAEVVATAGDTHLGGEDFDSRMVRFKVVATAGDTHLGRALTCRNLIKI